MTTFRLVRYGALGAAVLLLVSGCSQSRVMTGLGTEGRSLNGPALSRVARASGTDPEVARLVSASLDSGQIGDDIEHAVAGLDTRTGWQEIGTACQALTRTDFMNAVGDEHFAVIGQLLPGIGIRVQRIADLALNLASANSSSAQGRATVSADCLVASNHRSVPVRTKADQRG